MPRIGHLLWIGGVLTVAGFGAAQLARGAGGRAVCDGLGDAERRECYRRALSRRLAAGGVAAAAAALDSFAALDRHVAEHAHEYAHGIGIEAFGSSRDIAALFAACGDGYSSGCRHGVIQAYFEAADRVGAAEVEALCRPFKPPAPSASRWVLFQCVHGMGHGLTMLHGHDLPRALADCDLLSDGWDRESCYGGAFMENVINATTPHHPATQLAAQSGGHRHATFKALDRDDLHYPCSAMAPRHLHACYQMQTSVMLHVNGGDIGGAARACERAPAEMRRVCFQSLGRDITSYALRDPAKTARLCERASVADRPACYVGAAKALVDWTATTGGALEFCRLAANGDPAGAGARSCYQALGEEVATLLAAPAERARECARAEHPAAVAACRAGAGI